MIGKMEDEIEFEAIDIADDRISLSGEFLTFLFYSLIYLPK